MIEQVQREEAKDGFITELIRDKNTYAEAFSNAMTALNKERPYTQKLEQWCKSALEVLQIGVQLIPLDQLRHWQAVRAVIESCPLASEEPQQKFTLHCQDCTNTITVEAADKDAANGKFVESFWMWVGDEDWVCPVCQDDYEAQP